MYGSGRDDVLGRIVFLYLKSAVAKHGFWYLVFLIYWTTNFTHWKWTLQTHATKHKIPGVKMI